ncbi:MAG: GntR family transcriptional regulator, partial [Pseudomonadota bacterium]
MPTLAQKRALAGSDLDGASDEPNGGVGSVFARLGPPQLIRDQALETIKSAIISGRLKPGARLKDRELCDALGVSRTIVREVIRELAADKLVEITAHRGPRVAILTPKMAREIYDMRAELEVMLVRAFIANTPQESLWPLMAEVEDAAARESVEDLVAIMQRLYGHLLRGADNDVLADILLSLLARISWLRVTSMTEPSRIAR